MICKNCGKEVKNEAAFCLSCGAKTEKSTVINVDTATAATEKTKKKYTTKFVVGALIFVVLIIVIAVIGSIGDDDVSSSKDYIFKSNSQSGASFDCTIDDVISGYNKNIDKHLTNGGDDFKLDIGYFIKKNGKYFMSSSNNAYSITIFIDENDYVYGVEYDVDNSLLMSDEYSDLNFILIRGLFNSVEPDKSYDEISEILGDTIDNGVLQKDNVKHVVIAESSLTKFASMAVLDE